MVLVAAGLLTAESGVDVIGAALRASLLHVLVAVEGASAVGDATGVGAVVGAVGARGCVLLFLAGSVRRMLFMLFTAAGRDRSFPKLLKGAAGFLLVLDVDARVLGGVAAGAGVAAGGVGVDGCA